MEKEEKNLGLAISKTAKCIRHGMEAWIASHMGDEITTQQGRLLGYLYRHPEAGAADIQLSLAYRNQAFPSSSSPSFPLAILFTKKRKKIAGKDELF